ncbi:MAG: glycosyltransferase [Candidatus Aenigmarchaeota archaeon]|nr:glycosyltransferase [Candidatus Aenigmarchaeota archaeon]
MKTTFLYPDAKFSPHKSLEQWALSVSQASIKTPKGFGRFDINSIPYSDILLIESLYCLPFAKKYKIAKSQSDLVKMTESPDKKSISDLAIGTTEQSKSIISKTKECKIIAMIVDTSFWLEKLSIFRKLYYSLYLDVVDGFMTLSERSKKDIEKFMKDNGYKKKPIIVIRPFMANAIKPSKKTLNKNILFIGNEAEEKGYLKLVKAMDYLPDFQLYLVGNCKQKLPKKLPKNIHIEGRVNNLKKYMEICTYYCHPADFEPFGVAPLEAMYAGLIPILTKDVGMTEIFTTSLKKLLLSDNSPEHIARMVQFIDRLAIDEKTDIIKESKRLASGYTKEKNIKLFKNQFDRLAKVI